jgi:hypothetical protein
VIIYQASAYVGNYTMTATASDPDEALDLLFNALDKWARRSGFIAPEGDWRDVYGVDPAVPITVGTVVWDHGKGGTA